MVPSPTYIYHITHVDNLPSIVGLGELRAGAARQRSGFRYINIAHQNIQDRRSHTNVPCGPGGTLHDYVPFYFAPRSPMLYTISRGNVAGYNQGQEPIIYLVSTAQAVRDARLQFVFTDGHAIMAYSEFHDDLANLNRVDWVLMQSRYWFDTAEQPDRKRRRQAEFLVHRSLPWRLITEIGVLNARVQSRVEALLSGVEHKPVARVRTSWYY